MSGEGGCSPRQGHELHYRGRKPSFDRAQLGIIPDLLAQDASPTAIAEAAGVSRQVVYRVQDDPAKAGRCWPSGGCRPRTSPRDVNTDNPGEHGRHRCAASWTLAHQTQPIYGPMLSQTKNTRSDSLIEIAIATPGH
jgi:hypothetical protein